MCLFGQVECNLFPDIKNLYLRTVSPDEPLVLNLINKANYIFDKNTMGPQKYDISAVFMCFSSIQM